MADSMSFRDAHDAAYHAHKHALDMKTQPTPEQEMALYLKEARETIKNGTAQVGDGQTSPLRPSQLSQGNSMTYATPNGAKCIVFIDAAGNAAISTYLPTNK